MLCTTKPAAPTAVRVISAQAKQDYIRKISMVCNLHSTLAEACRNGTQNGLTHKAYDFDLAPAKSE
jgi:hypothetical protein